MRKMLLIPFAATCAVIASCAQVKAPASAEVSSPAAKTSSSEKKDVSSESSAPSSGGKFGTNPGAASSVSGVALPSLQDMGDGLDDIPLPLDPLPGDVRGNLRMPDLPASLPMSVDGKINSASF